MVVSTRGQPAPPYREQVVLQLQLAQPGARGLHSSTFQLNISPVCGIRWPASVCQRQTRLRLRWKVDECKPLPGGQHARRQRPRDTRGGQADGHEARGQRRASRRAKHRVPPAPHAPRGPRASPRSEQRGVGGVQVREVRRRGE
jgi:hypothetical protein